MRRIDLKQITVQYLYGAKAVDSLSVTLSAGERLAVFAEAEGGKTSLLKAIAGLLPVASGTMTTEEGVDFARLPVRARDVQMIYHGEGLFLRRSARANLAYPLKVRKVKRAARLQAVEEGAKNFGLTPILNDPVKLLFEDDRVRLQFARVSLRQGAVLLIDDPLRDAPRERSALFEELVIPLKRPDGIMVYATDNREEALTFDRVVVLRYGAAEQIATPAELRENPATLYVDRMFNRHRNRRPTDTVLQPDGTRMVEVCGRKLLLPADAARVICSYVLEATEGEMPVAGVFPCGARWLLETEEGLVLSDTVKTRTGAKVQGEIFCFSEESEKRLTIPT